MLCRVRICGLRCTGAAQPLTLKFKSGKNKIKPLEAGVINGISGRKTALNTSVLLI